MIILPNNVFRISIETCCMTLLSSILVGCESITSIEGTPKIVQSIDGDNTENDESSGSNSSNDLDTILEEIHSSQDLYDNTGLDDVRDDLDGSFCDDVSEEYENVPGAVSYFTGIYTSSQGEVSEQETWYGIEEWVLIPNTAWEEIQSETCYVVWSTVASRTEIETCLGCSLAMEVTASINYDETTCPEEIWNYAEYISWQADYEIALVGNISMFYYNSGTFLGMGSANNSAFNFLTDPKCAWF